MDKLAAPKLPNIGPFQFIREVSTELRKVNWPTRQETLKLTVVVIAVSVLVGGFIGGLDILLLNITSLVFQR